MCHLSLLSVHTLKVLVIHDNVSPYVGNLQEMGSSCELDGGLV